MSGKRRVVVGFSGGVSSAWCAGWALRNYPREEVVLLWHDTKEEHEDTIRFLHEMAAKLGMPITERSDGRSVTQVFEDEGFLGNNQNAMCSRILKTIPGTNYTRELQADGFDVIKVFGYSARESERIHRMVGYGLADGFTPLFPIVKLGITKQDCADWCIAQGIRPSKQYENFEHANCKGCVKGGRAYWIKTHEVHPDVFWQRAALEKKYGHPIVRGGGRDHPFLPELLQIGLKRKVQQRESINIGSCECGD